MYFQWILLRYLNFLNTEHTWCVPMFSYSSFKYMKNQFSPPHRPNSHSNTNTTWSNFRIFCSRIASICNNCNVFTCGRLTDLWCNVAVLKLYFSRVHKFTEKVGGEDERKVLSVLFLPDIISNHLSHCASLPWSLRWSYFFLLATKIEFMLLL